MQVLRVARHRKVRTMNLIELRGGLVVPADVLTFALQLEDRGVVIKADGEKLRVAGPDNSKPDLSPEEIAFITRWKPHLVAIASYSAPAMAQEAA